MEFGTKQLFAIVLTVIIGTALLVYMQDPNGFNQQMIDLIETNVDDINNVN